MLIQRRERKVPNDQVNKTPIYYNVVDLYGGK